MSVTDGGQPGTDSRYILVAEDNAGDISLIRLSLAEQGVTLELVVRNDGENAMHFLNEVDSGAVTSPALVVLDLNMPKIGGREILERMRQSAKCVGVPVVVFSSSDSGRDKQEVLSLGATLYVKKPSNLDDFLEVGKVLKELLDGTRQAATV